MGSKWNVLLILINLSLQHYQPDTSQIHPQIRIRIQSPLIWILKISFKSWPTMSRNKIKSDIRSVTPNIQNLFENISFNIEIYIFEIQINSDSWIHWLNVRSVDSEEDLDFFNFNLSVFIDFICFRFHAVVGLYPKWKMFSTK